MKNTIKQIFHSGKFVTGFVIFLAILLTIIIYPLVVAKDPLAMIGNGNFFKPGTYLSIQDTVNSGKTYKMNVDATASIVESKLTMDNRSMMAEWLEKYGGVDASEIDVTDAEGLIALWEEKYDPNAEQKGLIAAKKKKYQRLDNEIDGILEDVPTIIAEKNEETGELEEVQSIDSKQYINEKDVINRQNFVLGTDNFGRDVLTELISATGSSLKIGLVAGIIATVIGLFLGLLAGYLGGFVDNLILFFTNLFTVIPSFVLLILISYSVGAVSYTHLDVYKRQFLELHPTKYAEELVKKMEKSGAKAYLVNTGWNGTGKRISIRDTRGIIDAILSGAINEAPTKTIPFFNFEVPTELPGVDPAILDPRDTYADASEWETKALDLACLLYTSRCV